MGVLDTIEGVAVALIIPFSIYFLIQSFENTYTRIKGKRKCRK